MQSLIEHGQRAGTFRRNLPQQWLVTTAYSLMHAAAEDAAGRLDPGDRMVHWPQFRLTPLGP